MGRVRRNKANLRSQSVSSQSVHPSIASEGMNVLVYPADLSRRRQARLRRAKQQANNVKRVVLTALVLMGIVTFWPEAQERLYPDAAEIMAELAEQDSWPPLVIEGGNPYIRALMRTISASESNYVQPYHVLYGGRMLSDLSRHPDKCVRIVAGPNTDQCTTAAGRYQILTPTWEQIAGWYHPQAKQSVSRKRYSFQPEFQDRVVYQWLLDEKFWNIDIAQKLEDGELEEILDLLSGTWTSLGYGIEDNVMTERLPEVYHDVLIEELETAGYSSEEIQEIFETQGM
ncbi:MAG: glycoside hydrolase family protein [Microcoleaceae cyanobacterium]